ncbi:MAG: FHA domain-containing protein [Verrucomicrobiota bacterium]
MNKWLPKIIELFREEKDINLSMTIQAKGYLVDLWVEHGNVKRVAGCAPQELSHLILDPDACITMRRSVKDDAIEEVNLPISTLISQSDEMAFESDKRRTVQVPAEIIERIRNNYGGPNSNDGLQSSPSQSIPDLSIAQGNGKTGVNDVVSSTQDINSEPVKKVARAALRKMTLELKGEMSDFWLGRGLDCNIPVDDEKASRRHCKVFSMGHIYFLEDNHSTNGTYVNGSKVQNVGLQKADLIQIGETILEVVIPDSKEQGVAQPQNVQRGTVPAGIAKPPMKVPAAPGIPAPAKRSTNNISLPKLQAPIPAIKQVTMPAKPITPAQIKIR